MKRQSIADAKLARIESDAAWARMGKIERFDRDHGNLLITYRDEAGKEVKNIGYLHNGYLWRGSAAFILQHADPETMIELARGYRLAKKAGLLDAPAVTSRDRA